MESGDNDDARSEHTDDGFYDDGRSSASLLSDTEDNEEDTAEADAKRIENHKRIEEWNKEQERLREWRNHIVSFPISVTRPELGTVQAKRWVMEIYKIKKLSRSDPPATAHASTARMRW